MTLDNLKIISAGAGSGKTYRLTEELTALLASGQVRPSGIIATTFTRKAAAELQERVRGKLLKEGLTAEADELTNALIGTVHGLGVKLLKRFAFEAGVSPLVDILPDGDEQRLFNQSLSASLSMELIEEMDVLADRLGLSKRDLRFDWRLEVRKLADLARSNDMSLDDLEQSRQQSWVAFSAFLPEVDPGLDIQQAHAALSAGIKATLQLLTTGEDSTKTTQDVVQQLRTFQREYELRNELAWHQWVKIAKLKPGARSRDAMASLQELAWQHERIQAFRDDMSRFCDHIFGTAIAAMREYAAYKRRRGLIDYTDMEVMVSRLLDQPMVQEVLSKELDLLMVDEFQDTSPIQLDIFLKLSRLARQSIWVGDPKQSIYGFRGAEPRLMQAIIDAAGGIKPENIQTQSWRSRPDLVYAANAIFTKAFPNLPPEQVALSPALPDKADQGEALIHWHFVPEGDNKRPPARPWMEDCIAHSLREWLEGGPLVAPRDKSPLRPARPGDVAILCRTNSDCEIMAAALHRAGLRAALARAQLLATAEACLALACLKFLLNEEDSLANAEIQLLAGQKPLAGIVDERLDYLDRTADQGRFPSERWAADEPFISQLNALRSRCGQLSSAEILNLVLEELDLRRIIVAWGQAEQRLSNIDQLRKLAIQYEENCNNLHTAASLGGFLLWLGQLAARGEDMQGASEDPLAVNVLTYHKSKGLEWPAVVAHNLEQNLRADLWGLDLVADGEAVDLSRVLAGRWIRYWVNPYADQQGGTPLTDRMDGSAWQNEKRIQALAEEARLMYVGLTRARDYLIFPTREVTVKWINRVWNRGDENIPTLDPHTHESPWHWEGRFLNKNTRTFFYPRDFAVRHNADDELPTQFLPSRVGGLPYPPFFIDAAQRLVQAGLSLALSQVHTLAPPLERPTGVDLSRWTDLLSQWLIADNPVESDTDRQAKARRTLERYARIAGERPPACLDPAALLSRSAAWRLWLRQLGNGALKTRIPIIWETDGQYFEWVADWLLEQPDGWILVQQNNYAGDDPRQPAKDLAPGLYLASEGIKAATGKPVISAWMGFPWIGKAMAIRDLNLQEKSVSKN